jgi:hypothetical protein
MHPFRCRLRPRRWLLSARGRVNCVTVHIWGHERASKQAQSFKPPGPDSPRIRAHQCRWRPQRSLNPARERLNRVTGACMVWIIVFHSADNRAVICPRKGGLCAARATLTLHPEPSVQTVTPVTAVAPRMHTSTQSIAHRTQVEQSHPR